MLKTTHTVGALVLGVLLTACATQENTGRVIGGVLGGVAGSQVGDGRGRTAATVIGTIAGAAIGGAVGKSMDDTDRLKAGHALENNRTNQSSSWHNPDSGANYTVTPTRTWQSDAGRYCREYQTDVTVGGKTEHAYGTACRQPDGSWKVMN